MSVRSKQRKIFSSGSVNNIKTVIINNVGRQDNKNFLITETAIFRKGENFIKPSYVSGYFFLHSQRYIFKIN